MELRALRYFVTVAEELNFGRAAERLHIAQPAVSQQIARLERELGVRLLGRSPRHVRLTPAGARVLEAARVALSAADRVRCAAGAPGHLMRIGTAAGLTARLERGIDAMRRIAPHFDVALVDLPLANRFTALRQGELDVTLTRGAPRAPGLTVLPSWTEPLLAVVSSRHRAADRPGLDAADLAGSILRGPSRELDAPLHDAVSAALHEAGFRPRLGRSAGTAQDTVVEVGSDPESWTLLPAGQAEEIISARVRVLPLNPPITVTGNVVVPDHLPDRCAAAHAAAFGDADAAASAAARPRRSWHG